LRCLASGCAARPRIRLNRPVDTLADSHERFEVFRRGVPGKPFTVPETESPGDLAREAERGHSARAPMLALSGVTITIGVVVAVVVAVLLLIYFLV
jgi:hypothetical protein